MNYVLLYKIAAMKLYQIHTRQKLPITLEQAWTFLSNPRNLELVTPNMGFKILSGVDRPIYPGQIIQYIVSPFMGIRMRWVTEITHVIQQKYFVDEQRFGPYALWHHKHFIKEIDGGVEMEDIVDYKLPYGFLGSLAHSLFIKKKLQKIFAYREQMLTEIFGQYESGPKVIDIHAV